MAINKILVLGFFLLLVGCYRVDVVGRVVEDTIPSEINKNIEVYFCPQDDCEQVMIDLIDSARKTVYCALFDIDLRDLIEVIGKKSRSVDVKLVVDDENYGEIIGPRVKQDTSSQFSHNKFCIIDKQVFTTGSMNPTSNGATKNNNNLLVVYSKYLAKNYLDEFDELWAGNFGEGEVVKYPVIYLNDIEIENYFCPEDNCADQIVSELAKAEKSIYFMTFSFTNEEIADAMLFNDKATIIGLFEKRGSGSEYSQYNRLKDFGLDVRLDTNSYTMHHKVFIIDNRTVITGSMNPTGAGNHKNDENILVIHDKKIASRYVEEFFRLYG